MNQSDFLLIIGSAIRAKRKAQRLSQEKLAELAELHPTYISEIERGRVNSSVYSFYMISTALGIEFADLLNLPAENVDRSFEQELMEVVGRIRRMDKEKRKLFLLALKGMLSGLENI